MTKIDVYSGFLGAGKTTLIKKMISEAYRGEKLVLIENEFGQIGIDSGFLQDAGIHITEMNSGCICCSLVGDFGKALEKVICEYHPDRILIEPSGVGKLSDVVAAVKKVTGGDVEVGFAVAVVDAGKVKVYSKNFGEFYNDQVETASTIIMSRTDTISQQKLDTAVSLLREKNPHATIVTTPWDELSGMQLLEAMEGKHSVARELAEMEAHHHHHHEHHHHHDEDCTCGCHDHEHHHHHDEDCTCGCHDHEHHHHHDEGCTCGCHDHDNHHHHHADEVFTSWGVETAKKFTCEQIRAALAQLDAGKSGFVLRAKGIVPCADGGWIHFDYVPGEENVRMGASAVTGKLCVIGANLNQAAVAEIFGV